MYIYRYICIHTHICIYKYTHLNNHIYKYISETYLFMCKIAVCNWPAKRQNASFRMPTSVEGRGGGGGRGGSCDCCAFSGAHTRVLSAYRVPCQRFPGSTSQFSAHAKACVPSAHLRCSNLVPFLKLKIGHLFNGCWSNSMEAFRVCVELASNSVEAF